MHAVLSVKILYRLAHFVTCELLDDLFQFWVFFWRTISSSFPVFMPASSWNFYAQAVSADQQKAHKKVVRMVLPAKFPEKLKAPSAAPPE
jgi:hypothetical protein